MISIQTNAWYWKLYLAQKLYLALENVLHQNDDSKKSPCIKLYNTLIQGDFTLLILSADSHLPRFFSTLYSVFNIRAGTPKHDIVSK